MNLYALKEDLAVQIHTILDIDETIHISFEYPNIQFGDLAIPCFQFAKILKKSPQDIANTLQLGLKDLDYIQDINIVGAYLNLRFKSSYIIEHIISDKLSELPTQDKQKIALEFASPNTNKPLHLGHIRNIAIGEALYNILTSQGHQVIKTEIINDRGIAVAKMMLIYDKFHRNEIPDIKSDHYAGNLYIEFEHKSKENPKLIDEAQEILAKWENGDQYWYDIWLKLRNWVIEGIQQTYQKLGTSFDEHIYESDIYKQGKDIVQDGLNRGIFKQHTTEGYIYADLEAYNLPNKILLRSQGTALYITQDLYLLKYRLSKKSKCHNADKLIYITDFSQNLQFQQLFAIAEQLGIKREGLYHIGYGLFRLPEGKMSSRKGTVVNADPLIQEIEDKVREIYFKETQLEPTEITRRVDIIARASYIYYILSISTKKDIVFDINSSISLTGKTGPYILYTYARLRSILNKSGIIPEYMPESDYNSVEHNIIIKLSKFSEIRDQSAKEYDPAYIAHYLYELAEMINSYYHTTQILKETDSGLKNNKLYLLERVNTVISRGLELLSIQTLDEM
ncbi:MAG: Arginine--tRNA ligase [Candidatus Parcubacteria bacterium]|jgi:arginyl-tRNA synthetase